MDHKIIDVNPTNLNQYDLFCKKSKKKCEGYQHKAQWFLERFKEGLKIKVEKASERVKK